MNGDRAIKFVERLDKNHMVLTNSLYDKFLRDSGLKKEA